jgi:hypothetical protein
VDRADYRPDDDGSRKERSKTEDLVLTGAVVGGSGLAVALAVLTVLLLRRGRGSA